MALTTPDSQVPSPPSYPMTDDDGLDEALAVERFSGGPLPAPRAGLLARVRDHFAMRRTLSRPADDLGDGVEIFSGTGAPSRAPRLSRAELARRRSESLRPSGLDLPAPPQATGIAYDAVGEVTGRTAAAPPRREPSLYQQLPPPARPSAYLASDTVSRRPHPQPADLDAIPTHEEVEEAAAEEMDEVEAPDRVGLGWGLSGPDPMSRETTTWRPPAVEPVPPPATTWRPSPSQAAPPSTTWRPRDDSEIAAAGALPPAVATAAPPSPSQAREGRRLLALFGVAALVMFAVGLASAHSSSPAPVATTQPSTSQSSAGQAPATQSQSAGQPAVVPPAQGQPATQGEPGPTAVAGLNDVKTLGDGGTGYQVSTMRWGDHTTYLRAVFALSPNGAASGKPKVSVGFSDPTTMLIALYGVAPAGSTGSLPKAKVVTGVTLLQPSPIAGATVYQVKLVHPVTVNPLYTGTSPLLLVIDIPS